ncbi:cytochrome B6 [Enterovibrio norvegicus]|uniref:cytochrome-c peroxidase n=1 Tax=Enterovibrio norvegicus TaxID=188144 RepID=UPI000C8236C1|nr:cytochrome c peroxidase [Enterovibrio norvegicus]PMH62719.1 cytochrome B6 [Enterovibrio norvegicus]PMI37358.1 cytochrome B6 [Enterovibrio norvegicus]PMN49950.1 cytochrome B6 [Enterovibrio norvegicus]
MVYRRVLLIGLLSLIIAIGVGILFAPVSSLIDRQGHDSHSQGKHADINALYQNALVFPIPSHFDYDLPLIRVGWTLFRDEGLSSNNSVSCNSCHNLQTNGAETTPVSVGVGGAGSRNSLTVFNAALNYRFFWDGRTNSLKKQMNGPVHAPKEMASSWAAIVDYVASKPDYRTLFDEANILPISADSIQHALVAFQESLLTPNSPFDRYLNGDQYAIDSSSKQGWIAFQELGCINCHQGQNIGGSLMQRFGYYDNATSDGKKANEKDMGRYLITQQNADKYLFRVASLRNVADTPPYFHDGRTSNLEEAIEIMANIQTGHAIELTVINDLSAFLHSLSAPRPQVLEILERE